MKVFDLKKFAKSFSYAGRGIYQLIRNEQNARVHLLASVAVVAAGWPMGLNRYEWLGICVAIGLVWSAEAANTAIEKLVDMVSPERRPEAGLVKDIAAGGVLICAIVAVIIALLVFLPHVCDYITL
jgi:diacylglycerol kinase (ATP)